MTAAALCFNPRPHAAGDLGNPVIKIYGYLFQSTPARGGRLRGRGRRRGRRCFNPRPHAAGDASQVVDYASIGSFNPRPHAAGDRPIVIGGSLGEVSIHARTRRATPAPGVGSATARCSIHARTRRATG